MSSALAVGISFSALAACSLVKTVTVCKEVKNFKVVRMIDRRLGWYSHTVDYLFIDGSHKMLGLYYHSEDLARASAEVSVDKIICWDEKVEDAKTK